MTAIVIAVALSLASTNEYVYAEPQNIEITGSASFGSDGIIRGEDVAFSLEAFRERAAALEFVSTNGSRSSKRYDASQVSSARFNDVQNLKSQIISNSHVSACYLKSDIELPDSVVLTEENARNFVAAIGGEIQTQEFDSTKLSTGSALTNAIPARLNTGLEKLTRVAFWSDVGGKTNGFSHSTSEQWSGEPQENFNEYTGQFTPGTLPPDTQTVYVTHGYIVPEHYKLNIESWKNKDQAWYGDFDDEGYVVWTRHASSETGPRSQVFTDKITLNENYHTFCPGNAGMSSALVDSVSAYAVCSYYHSVNGSSVTEKMVAIKLNATTDYSYQDYHNGYLPRMVIEPLGPDALFSATLEALGETRITTSSVVGRLPAPPEPSYPGSLYPPQLDEYTLTGRGSHAEETQEVHVESLIVVIDYDFNAKTL